MGFMPIEERIFILIISQVSSGGSQDQEGSMAKAAARGKPKAASKL
jgi:hypothetical protein